jgi:hypothetical protein
MYFRGKISPLGRLVTLTETSMYIVIYRDMQLKQARNYYMMRCERAVMNAMECCGIRIIVHKTTGVEPDSDRDGAGV